MADLFKQILDKVSPEDVKKVKAKRPRGRPKAIARIEAEEDAARKEFIENFEPKSKRRPEPSRMIVALSLPAEKQQQALEDAMTPRQLAFCKEYVLDYSAKDAAIRAGYDVKNAGNSSYNLMQYRGINRLIEIYTESNAQKVTTVDKDWIINKVTEIVTTAGKDGDKLRGLELLARHLGMFVDRTEITGKDGEAIKYEEARREADSVARQIRSMASRSGLKVVDGGKDS